MNYRQFLEQVKQYTIHFFKSKDTQKLLYHNLAHTQMVVANAEQIARHYQLGEKDFFVVMTAAWFHDTGYLNGDPAEHEQRGADIASRFLKDAGVEEETIQAIRQCVMATRTPQSPVTLAEKIVCDADLFHFGTADFAERNKLMRKESEWRIGKKIGKNKWTKGTIRFLESHKFQTDYCRNLLKDRKQQNLRELKQQGGEPKEASIKESADDIFPALQEEFEAISTMAKKQKTERPERGIETMFRISSTNSQRLSDMADNKAHIMITTTSIIISVLLSLLLRKLEDNPQLVIPTLVLLTVCVVTMVFCILATRPRLPNGTFTQDDIKRRDVNLLFFGNFYRMRFDEYDVGMKQMMNDREFLYGTLIRDLYSQGRVLGKKYRLLRKGYSVFMYGIVASVIAFIIATVFG